MQISETASVNINCSDNVRHKNSTKGYTLNIDRALRNKINACKQVKVDYSFTGGGIKGEMDTATFELFRTACTTFYSRLPPERGQCEIDMSEDKNRKAVVQQTYKVKREVSSGELIGYTINLYTTCNRILINGKDIDLFMDEHLPAIHDYMMKPIDAGILTGVRGLNHILQTEMQSLLDQRLKGINSVNSQNFKDSEEITGKVVVIDSSPDSELPRCSVCKRFLRSRGVVCEKGQHWIHYHCDKLTQDEINRLHTDKGFIFNCKKCSKDDTAVKVPIESTQTSVKNSTLELPSITHGSCAQADSILSEEQDIEYTSECCVCGCRVGDEAVACLQCNSNCHKGCMESNGMDFVCLHCKSVNVQISMQTMKQTEEAPTNLKETESDLTLGQTSTEQEVKLAQVKTVTQNSKYIDSVMKQRELRQWEQKLRKWEESLKLKESKQTDQDKDKQKFLEYINKLEARNDELSMTVSTLQRRIDVLENPLAKSEIKAGNKEPQRSTAHREEVDDLIIGVRERVTRFLLRRVDEQIDALENQTLDSRSTNSTNRYKIDTQIMGRDRNNIEYHEGSDYQNKPVNQIRQTTINPDAVNLNSSVNKVMQVNRNIDTVNTQSTSSMVLQHSGPLSGERHNAAEEPVVMGNNISDIRQFVGQPLIKETDKSYSVVPNQSFLYQTWPYQHLR